MLEVIISKKNPEPEGTGFNVYFID